MTRQEKRNQKDISKLVRQRKQQKYASTGVEPKAGPPPRIRLDTRTADWDELDHAPPSAKAAIKRAAIAAAANLSPGTEEGLVIGVGPGRCRLQSGEVTFNCKGYAGLAVGDRVSFSDRAVREILPRRTTLSRPDPYNPGLEKVLAANVDVVVNVVSINSPPLRLGLIDRYLIAIQRGGAEPLICVNKIDLVHDEKALEPLEVYRSIGLELVYCSAATGAGIEALLEKLAGRTCVFTGHSGVGKSSLLNAINPSLKLSTNVVNAVHKGQHTTTSSSLHFLPNGTRIIDTPGIRQLGLWEISREDLRGYFYEFVAFARGCAFADCSHTHEPNCQVLDAVKHGDITAGRYAAYLRIMETLES